MGVFKDPILKRKKIEEFEKVLEKELANFTPPPGFPKIFTLPLDESTQEKEFKFFLNTDTFLPEDFYIWQIVKFIFEKISPVSHYGRAKAIFVPLYLPAYFNLDIDLWKTLRDYQKYFKGRIGLYSYLWDDYIRTPFTRANPYCVIGNKIIKPEKFLKSSPKWLNKNSILFSFENTIDTAPQDIGIAPLPLDYKSNWKLSRSDRLLYSFCGVTEYNDLPMNHIRGQLAQPHWKKMENSNAKSKSFVGRMDLAKMKFGEKTDFRDFSKNSDFTLCPAGWARWSFRIFEAIKDGSIPVLLTDFYSPPFSNFLNWSDFSLQIPESYLGDVPRILSHITSRKKLVMQSELKKNSEKISTIKGIAQMICQELALKVSRI